jgi:hypothetical protein
MNVIAAILILGATGHAERSVTVEGQQIAGVFARVIGGAVGDAFRTHDSGQADISKHRAWRAIQGLDLQLTIDGQPQTGWRSWGEAVWRVVGYAATDAGAVGPAGGDDASGSVGYSYRLQLRGYDVRRATRIENGRVVLTTDAWWTETVPVLGRITRRVPIHVCITIRADEDSDGTTRIVGTVTGTADTSDFRCRRIRNKHAEPEANAAFRVQLPAVLRDIQQRGTDLYLGSADIGPVLDGIGEAMRTVGPRIGRR